MTRRPLSSIENILHETVSTTTRSSTGSIPRGIRKLDKNREKLCADVDMVFSAIQKIRDKIDQQNLAQYIRNRQTGSLQYTAQQRENFWQMPEENLHNYKDWLNKIKYWKMLCNFIKIDENTSPADLNIFREIITKTKQEVALMKSKCKQFQS